MSVFLTDPRLHLPIHCRGLYTVSSSCDLMSCCWFVKCRAWGPCSLNGVVAIYGPHIRPRVYFSGSHLKLGAQPSPTGKAESFPHCRSFSKFPCTSLPDPPCRLVSIHPLPLSTPPCFAHENPRPPEKALSLYTVCMNFMESDMPSIAHTAPCAPETKPPFVHKKEIKY